MSLVTRCTKCATTFRVLPAQLSARGGRVRCGKCAVVFDGVANLLTEEAIASRFLSFVITRPEVDIFEFLDIKSKTNDLDAQKKRDTAPAPRHTRFADRSCGRLFRSQKQEPRAT